MKIKMYEVLQLKRKELTSWKKFSYWGTALMILGALGMIAFLFSDITNAAATPYSAGDRIFGVFVYVIFLAGGLILYFKGAGRKKVAKRYTDYLAQLAGKERMSLPHLAEQTRVPIDTVRTDLSYMLLNNYFPDARLNEASDELILWEETEKEQPEEKMIAVECPNCTAINMVKRGGVCEYCGQNLGGQ